MWRRSAPGSIGRPDDHLDGSASSEGEPRLEVDSLPRFGHESGTWSDVYVVLESVLSSFVLSGMLQYIPSKSLAVILQEFEGNLQEFLRAAQTLPSSTSPATFGISPSIMDAYVKSCGMATAWWWTLYH